MKTRADVENLKQLWRQDPLWDLEDTEGFEEFYVELKNYRDACQAQWHAVAADLGVPGNINLAHKFTQVLARLEHLEQRCAHLESLHAPAPPDGCREPRAVASSAGLVIMG